MLIKILIIILNVEDLVLNYVGGWLLIGDCILIFFILKLIFIGLNL